MNTGALLRVLLACGALAMASGCATGNGGGDGSDSSPGASRSGVEVFGTIDAGVSSVRNKSGR